MGLSLFALERSPRSRAFCSKRESSSPIGPASVTGSPLQFARRNSSVSASISRLTDATAAGSNPIVFARPPRFFTT